MKLKKRLNNLLKGVIDSPQGPCTHEVMMNNMCVSCGKAISKKDIESTLDGGASTASTSNLTVVGGSQLILSRNEALKTQRSKSKFLRKERKLALVLDLDHTLIHTIAIQGPPTRPVIGENPPEYMQIAEVDERSMTSFKHFMVKRRPHLNYFLETASKKFQLSIYTAGTRPYAEGIANFIDPTGKWFNGRIVSRSDGVHDANSHPLGLDKSLKKLFLGDTSMVFIMDDREDVWRGEQGQQLLLVRPFHHFQGGLEVNNASGLGASSAVISLVDKSLGSAEDYGKNAPSVTVGDDDQLLRNLQILDGLHADYYAQLPDNDKIADAGENEDATPPLDTAHLLSELKRSVLKGCVITFSGLVPTNEPEPHMRNVFWRIAVSLGAQVTWELCPRTTHLITTQTQTRKVELCHKEKKVWILHPDWLLSSSWSLRKMPEKGFLCFPLFEGDTPPNPTLDPSPVDAAYMVLPKPAQEKLEMREFKRQRKEAMAQGNVDLLNTDIMHEITERMYKRKRTYSLGTEDESSKNGSGSANGSTSSLSQAGESSDGGADDSQSDDNSDEDAGYDFSAEFD